MATARTGQNDQVAAGAVAAMADNPPVQHPAGMIARRQRKPLLHPLVVAIGPDVAAALCQTGAAEAL
jgi:hypothetical protein